MFYLLILSIIENWIINKNYIKEKYIPKDTSDLIFNFGFMNNFMKNLILFNVISNNRKIQQEQIRKRKVTQQISNH